MYGSIMRARVKKGGLEALQRLFETRRDRVTGAGGFHSIEFAQEDKDPSRIVSIIHFKDKESYVKNSEAPETRQNYEEMVKHFEGAPEWIDISYRRYFGQPVTESAVTGSTERR